MQKAERENTDSKRMGIVEGRAKKTERKPTVAEIKKKLGLDSPVIEQPIRIKYDGKHLYQVAGFTYPLRPETIDRLNIPPQRIICEVDREQWHREQDEAREKHDETIDPELYPWGYEA